MLSHFQYLIPSTAIAQMVARSTQGDHLTRAAHPFSFGGKTLALVELSKLGALSCSVPAFVAVPSEFISSLWPGSGRASGARATLTAEVRTALPVSRYAVRSSALNEDSRQSAQAGVYHSAVDVSADGLEAAIAEVVEQAAAACKAPETFSLLIQEYILAEFSGVLFSRDPLGGRELVIEYGPGSCQTIVSGEQSAKRFRIYHDSRDFFEAGRDFESLIRSAQRIEAHFGFPQDIEWCFGGGKWWIVQSRPITSITSNQFAGMLFLDGKFESRNLSLYERTAVSEIAPKPCPATFSLLERLYEAGGPLANVYRRYGIHYQPQKFLACIGNELFCDRLAERRTLFPAQVLTRKGTFQSSFRSLRSLFITWKNAMAFWRIREKREIRLREELEKRLTRQHPEHVSIGDSVSDFLSDYEIIFEINLLADRAVQRLSGALSYLGANPKEVLSELLSRGGEGESEPIRPSACLRGNSLDLLDESPFTPAGAKPKEISAALDFGFSGWKKNYLHSMQASAARLARLREAGRWLAVLHINRIRRSMRSLGEARGLSESDDVFFFSLTELAEGNVTSEIAAERRRMRKSLDSLEFPGSVGSVFIDQKLDAPLGVSPGIARGLLVTEAELAESDLSDEQRILIVPHLAPHLVRYFSKISGIVSERGGLLSHLAIMAREHGMPVVVHVRQSDPMLIRGTAIEINGTSGKITRVSVASK